jgi:uncharacterized repeat protein (TIGR02543 family)
MRYHSTPFLRRSAFVLCAAAAAFVMTSALHGAARAQDPVFASVDVVGPPGSGSFGTNAVALPNGNFVVTDPTYDGLVADVGAVYLYDGATLALISQLTGSTVNDKVGSAGIVVLTNGNFVVRSPLWDNSSPAATDAGATTFVDATSGLTGTVSVANSLVGGSNSDNVGGVTPLRNGNYVVVAINWDNPVGPAVNAGAVAFGNGVTGSAGVVSAANALVGSTASDSVGSELTTLFDGAYVVRSPQWNNGGAFDAGAATWCDGVSVCAGALSAANSLVGSTNNDRVGDDAAVLSNGNYVVYSDDWDNGGVQDAGAVTWANAATGVKGVVSASNSLVGSTAQDSVGWGRITALTNGNYVVSSPLWDAPGAVNAGAATWCSGNSGCTGPVLLANSLIGGTASDQVSGSGIEGLTNGNYVIASRDWDGAATDVGAVTWGNGTIGLTGVVTFSNSLVGATADDEIGSDGVTALTNGNYVVNSVYWRNPGTGATDAGAVTWGNGAIGTTGVVSTTNSLVGSQTSDYVGEYGVTPLANGNYLVESPLWNNGLVTGAGALTWGNGLGGTVGEVGATNSLVGATSGELGTSTSIYTLDSGAYVVHVPDWDNTAPAVTDAGAARFSSGAAPLTGAITPANSLVGSKTDDLNSFEFTGLTNGNYVIGAQNWDNGPNQDAGAAVWGSGATGVTGFISNANSLVGLNANDHVGGTVFGLPNGNYVVGSPDLDVPALSRTDIGAVTWGNGATGTQGAPSLANSVFGRTNGDRFGFSFAFLPYDNIVVQSRDVDNPVTAAVDSGAVSLLDGNVQSSGVFSGTNSVLGLAPSGGSQISTVLNSTQQYIIVKRPLDNIVTLAALRWKLNVDTTGSGSGTVTSSLPGINCGITCSVRFNDNLVITLTATSLISSTFGGWSGDCTGTVPCAVTMDRTRHVTATFDIKTFPLTTSTAGSGGGAIGGTPANPAALSWGTVVTLTATPNGNSTFTGWSGDCTGTTPCVVTMTQARSVTANFAQITHALTVNTAGTGTGTISGLPAVPGAVPQGTLLALTAVPATSSTFSGWSGDCTGTGVCNLSMTGAKSVTADFTLKTFALTVSTAGSGSGSVTGIPANPGAINYGTSVALTAVPAAGSAFIGWSGDCTGTGACNLSMTQARSVTATFETAIFEVTLPQPSAGGVVEVELVTTTVAAEVYSVSVVAGDGVSTASVEQLNATYPAGSVLKLTAVPNPLYAFEQWGGALSGTANPQQVTVTGPLTIVATFAPAPVYLPTIDK